MIPQCYSMISYQRTGSNYTCNPPVTDTDIDFIILVDDYQLAQQDLYNQCFDNCSDFEYIGNLFKAFRRENLNYIITYDVKFYERFCAATELAKSRNLLYKCDRVALFKTILYDDYPTKYGDDYIDELGVFYE